MAERSRIILYTIHYTLHTLHLLYIKLCIYSQMAERSGLIQITNTLNTKYEKNILLYNKYIIHICKYVLTETEMTMQWHKTHILDVHSIHWARNFQCTTVHFIRHNYSEHKTMNKVKCSLRKNILCQKNQHSWQK